MGDCLRGHGAWAVDRQGLVLERETEPRHDDGPVGVEGVGTHQPLDEVDCSGCDRQLLCRCSGSVAQEVVADQRPAVDLLLAALEVADVDGGQVGGHRVVHHPGGGGLTVGGGLTGANSGGGRGHRVGHSDGELEGRLV